MITTVLLEDEVNYLLIDEEDYDLVNEYVWVLCKNSDNTYRIHARGHRGLTIHELIMTNMPLECFPDDDAVEATDDLRIIHLDNSIFNNTRANLKLVPRSCASRFCQKHRSKYSPYTGTHYDARNDAWGSSICIDYKVVWLGTYDTAEDAARSYDRGLIRLKPGCSNGLLNFPTEREARLKEIAEGIDNKRKKTQRSRKRTGASASKYRGVALTPRKDCCRYLAQIKYNKKTLYLGTFDVEEDAGRAYDVKAKELYGDCALLNFPEEDGKVEPC